MPEPTVFADATVFLGMHHRDDVIRRRSIGLFCRYLYGGMQMNFEQIGICDAVIWRESRGVQDLYYPFMDRLHTDMQILREGYTMRELELAAGHRDLKALRPEQALLVAQVIARDGVLATHDPVLLQLACVQPQLWRFEPSPPPAIFPETLQALYETSRVFVHRAQE